MSGDKELGLKYLKNVAENGNLFKAEALVALGIVYNNFENNLPASREYYSKLLEIYPENNLAAVQLERIDFILLIDEKGVDYFAQNFENLKDEYNIDDPTDLNILGYYLMNRQRLDDALAIFQLNIELYPDVANCYDSIAECFLNRNENDKAIKHYKLAYEKLPADTSANEEFKEFLRTNIQDRLEELGANINS